MEGKDSFKLYLLKLSELYKDGKITSEKKRRSILLANELKISSNVAAKLEEEFLKKLKIQDSVSISGPVNTINIKEEYKKYEQKQDIVFNVRENRIILTSKQLHEVEADALLTTSYINSPLDSGILKELISQLAPKAKQGLLKARLPQIGNVFVSSGEGTKFKTIIISAVCDFNSRIRLTPLALDQIMNKTLEELNLNNQSLAVLPFNKGTSSEIDPIYAPTEALLRNLKNLNGKTIYLLFKIFEKKDFEKLYSLLLENSNTHREEIRHSPVQNSTEIIPSQNTIPFKAYQGTGKYAFVSYSHKDNREVFNEISFIKEQGINIWYDEGIQPGNEWPEQLGKAILGSSLFIVFITPNSINSENVRNEINFALANKKPLLVIHLKETELTPGMFLQIGSLQAILKYKMTEHEYKEKLQYGLTLYLDVKK